MPMHTIPQNVTSYEDKVVGIFVGRQFIYLAVGGLTAFILLSTGGGAAVVFRFIMAIGVVAFSAALALIKVNDRGFDVWVLSYLKAVLGPTEWAWHKREPLMDLLSASDTTAIAATPTKAQPLNVRGYNNQRKEAFKHYVSGASKDLDPREQAFLEQLNFGEQLPIGSVITSSSDTSAPPMLTPEHPTLVNLRPLITFPEKSVVSPPLSEPVAALAQSTLNPSFTFNFDGQQKTVSMLNNQRANRSLSRQSLSGAAISIPAMGDARLDLDPAYQQELTNLIGFAPAAGSAPLFAQNPPLSYQAAPDDQQPAIPPPDTLPASDPTSVISHPNPEPVVTQNNTPAPEWNNQAMPVRHKLLIQKDEQTNLQAPAQDQPGQKALEDKLKQEEDRSAAFARELIQKMQQAQAAPQPAAAPFTVPTLAEPTEVPQPAAAPPPLKTPAIPLEQLPTLTTQVNTIHGFVFDLDGQFVESAIVVIKDDSGEAKRALKTNKLGQFLITTPLNNGHYMVEVDKKGLKIDAISLELTGQPIKPLIVNAIALA